MRSTIRKSLLGLTSLLTAMIVFLSCQKDIDETITQPGQPTDFTVKVTSGKISGFVTDENNSPVSNTPVTVGSANTTTNEYGYFEVKNAQVGKVAGTVVVNKPGYFKGIRTFIAKEGGSVSVRIKLIPKNIAGTIDASAGGTVNVSGGMTIAFPAGAIMNATTNAPYSGTVNVAAFWINPAANDIGLIMPGDLRGINETGTVKLLTTYGMVAVELTGTSGEALQIASGKKATLTMPIPSQISGTAPSSIPLWYFDETKGLWKQEGSAVKTGNAYVGEVSHFSFWNCDVPNDYVQLSLTVKDAAGNPISGAFVRLTANAAINNVAYGFTDSSGYVQGAVPPNASILMEIYGGYFNCGTPGFSQTISTGNTDLALGDVTISNNTNVATITGNVVNCSSTAVTDGSVVVLENGWYSVYPVNSDGSFSISRMLCTASTAISLIAEDHTAGEQSAPQPTTITGGINAIGTLQACGTSTAQTITYAVDGIPPITLTSPTDSVSQTGNGSLSSYGVSGNSSGFANNIYFLFSNVGMGVGTVQTLQSIYVSSLSQSLNILTPNCVNITEYGAIGEFIAGNFTTTVNDGTADHTISVSFRVRRVF
jgi:hypothetical protein